MPTNREWLEHTERAAWDTVQSLRKQIEDERERVRRLTPIRESWQRILELLDGAKTEHGLAGDGYAALVEALTGELRSLKAERDELSQKLTVQERAGSSPMVHPVQIVRMDPRTPSPEREAPWESGWFAERLDALRHEQAREGTLPRKASYEALLGAVELKLEELEEASGKDAVELAIELGALALRIAEQQKPARRDESPEDEDDL